MDEMKWNGFLRQRRALLAISVVLSFSQFAGLKLRIISFLGNELEVGYPIAVNIALWVLWVYWLYRFYVYSREVDALSATSSRYNGRLYQLLRDNARLLFQHDPIVVANLNDDKATYKNATCDSIDLYGYTPEGYRVGANKLTVEYVKDNGNLGCSQYGDYKAIIPHVHVRPLKRQAARYVALHTSIGTDFWLPYLVAAVPVVIALFQGVTIVITYVGQ